MWELFKSNTPPARFPDLRVYRVLLLFTLLSPVLFMGVRRGIYGELDGVLLSFLFSGLLLEFIPAWLLASLLDEGRIGKKRFFQLIYLVHTIIGLPFTIYLTLALPAGYPALLRFAPVLLMLMDYRSSIPGYFFSGFYGIGLLGVSIFSGGEMFSLSHVQISLMGLGLAILFDFFAQGRRRMRRELRDGGRRLALARLEARKRGESYRNILQEVLPDFQAQELFAGRRPPPEAGEGILLGIYPRNLALLPRMYQKNRDEAALPLEEFNREWELYLRGLQEKLENAGVISGGPARLWFAGRKLEGVENPQAELLRLLFLGREMLDYTESTNRQLRRRGLPEWQLVLGLTRGAYLADLFSETIPVWTIRGEKASELETFLTRAAYLSDADGCWIDPDLILDIHPFFDKQGARYLERWYQPGALLPEYSGDNEGLFPVADFYEKIKYLHDG